MDNSDLVFVCSYYISAWFICFTNKNTKRYCYDYFNNYVDFILTVFFISITSYWSPKDMFDIEFSKYSFQTDIVCNQLSSSKYEIIIRKNKTQILDMKGWIFKKTHIKDITLLHYHLDYYNKKQLKSFKCNSK